MSAPARTRAEMDPLTRAVSDSLDDHLSRHWNITTSNTDPEGFIAALREAGFEVVSSEWLEDVVAEASR